MRPVEVCGLCNRAVDRFSNGTIYARNKHAWENDGDATDGCAMQREHCGYLPPKEEVKEKSKREPLPASFYNDREQRNKRILKMHPVYSLAEIANTVGCTREAVAGVVHRDRYKKIRLSTEI